MKFKNLIQIIATLALLGGAYFVGRKILNSEPRHAASAEGGHGGAAAPEYERGPHGGRMLRDGDFAMEVTIYEPDIPPQSRVYPFKNDQPLDPNEVKLTLELHRFGGRVDTFKYKKEGEYLQGDLVVEEPHSFDVKVFAGHGGKKSQWEYQSYEGRVTMQPAAVETAGIKIEEAGPAKLRTMVEMNGKIVANPDKVAHVTPRYPGVVLEARKKLGDAVQKDEVLAVVESNDSLRPYEIKSQIAGRVIKRDAVLGESVSQDTTLYVIADLSTIAVDLAVPRAEFSKLKEGQKVMIGGDGEKEGEATLTYLSPIGAADTQTMMARAEMPNAEMAWQPGLFVTAKVVVEETEVPIAVKASGLQRFRDWDVVFMSDGSLFEIAILELGRRDGDLVEVVSGPLKPGTKYATENSFVVKADVLKSGASHDH
jgi:cobalt-zinc-cadmium efflux system membrane fusion protein